MPPSNRTERLLNLVIALASTRLWLTKEQIRRAVPQYADCESTEAFDRMFERDKEDLRELGVPLMTGSHESWFDDEVGYRIDRATYALPDVEFTASELGVLSLASRVWTQASLAGPAARAMVKLKALGVRSESESLVGVEPRVRTTEAAFDLVYAATRDGAPVSFGYRRPGQSEPTVRSVEPWALTSRGGWWYLIGWDRDRAEARVFKLSRVEGRVRRIGPAGSVVAPPDLEPAAMLQTVASADGRLARLRLRQGRGAALRLSAQNELPGDNAPTTTDHHGNGSSPQDWDEITLPIGDLGELAAHLAGYAADVVVLDPPDLRRAVVDRLQGVVRTYAGPGQATHGTTESERSTG